MPETFLRLPEVVKRCGLSRSRIYALIQIGRFPPQVKIGIRAIGWPESVINEWQANRMGGAA